jgi:hypothetical protein
VTEPLTSEELAAELALSRAMMRLGGESPSQVYTEDGYVIWVRSVAKEVTEPYRSAVAALTAEKERLERALEDCIDTAAELRRHIHPDKGCGYSTYREVWDASFKAEAAAREADR